MSDDREKIFTEALDDFGAALLKSVEPVLIPVVKFLIRVVEWVDRRIS